MTTVLRSSQFLRVPDHLAGRVRMEATPVVGPWEEASYSVVIDSTPIGRVTRHRTESWRTHGRIRTSLRGRPVHWQATLGWKRPGQQHVTDRQVGCHFSSRGGAALALVRAYEDRIDGT